MFKQLKYDMQLPVVISKGYLRLLQLNTILLSLFVIYYSVIL
jgi:hypothetical protein